VIDMDPAPLFDLVGPLSMAGWALLVAAPLAPRLADLVAGQAIPAALAVVYAALVLVNWAGAEGGFGSLAEVMRLFDDPGVALAGWTHFLAFDLFVGAWEVRTARRAGLPHLLVLPCLGLTLLFGPAGFLLFLGLMAAWRRFAPRPAES
jgi:hypothetical protein